MNLTINLEIILLVGLIIAFFKIHSLKNLLLEQNDILRKYLSSEAEEELYRLSLKKPNYAISSKFVYVLLGVLLLMLGICVTLVLMKIK